MIDTDKYEGHDNWDGTKINMNNKANVNLVADAPKILNAYKKLLAENRRLYERMNLAEEYIRNPQSWISYSFEVLNKNLGENEEYMMDSLRNSDEREAEAISRAEEFGADEYKGKQIYTQLNEFLSQFKKISIKGKPYIVVYEWDNYYEVYPLTEVYGFMGAIRSKLKQWENHKGYAPQKIITKKGYAQPTQNYYDMRTGKWVEDNAWTYEYAGKPGTQAEVRELITYSNYNAEEFGAESCTCNDMFGSLCPQCNYDSDREGGVCPKGCTVDLAGSVRPQEMEIYTECKIHGQKLGAESFGAEFSRGEMLNLRKYIDYPMRWVNKNIRPSSDSKERKTEQKMKGQIPRRKSPDSFRNTIETPTWFKGIQIGILATIFGAMYVSETNKKRKK